MRRTVSFAVLAVVTAILFGCNSSSRTVSQLVNADPDSTWAAVKKVVEAKQIATPATIDETTRTITIKNAFGEVKKTREGSDTISSIESYDAVITMRPPTAVDWPGADEITKAGYTWLTIKVKQTRPVFSTSDEDTHDGHHKSSYGVTMSTSSEIHDQFMKEIRKELDAMKAQQAQEASN